MKNTAEFAIIGGGIMGVSIAYHLARLGRDVLLLEKGDFGGGTSRATAAWVSMREAEPGHYGALAWRAWRNYQSLEKQLEADVEYHVTGGLRLLHTREELEAARVRVAGQQAAGYDIQLLGTAETLALEPLVNPAVLGSIYCAYDGYVNPFLLVDAYVRAARRHGARLFSHTPVTGFEVTDGRISSLRTPQGPVQVETVLCAAGIQSLMIGKMLDIPIPVHAEKGSIAVSEKLPPRLRHVLFGACQNQAGNILFGTSHETGNDTRLCPEGLAAVARKAQRDFPALASVSIIRAFSGVRCLPDDGYPVLGPPPNISNLWFALSHSVFRLHTALAPLVAALLCGKADLQQDCPYYAYSRFL